MDSKPSSKRRPRRSALALGVGALALLIAAIGVTAVTAKQRNAITPVPRSDRGATELARSIFENPNSKLVRSKFVTVPPGHDPVATTTKSIAGFPRKGESFAILSTGCAHYALWKNVSTDTGCKDGGLKIRGARDVTIWRIRVQVPKAANCLSFRFKFLSDEYPEFVGSPFNDAFIAELSDAPRWRASTKTDPAISAPNSFASTRNGQDLISVNGTGVAKVSPAAAKGTTYDAATGKLRASVPVKPGAHLLHLSLFDQGDRQYDSAVFVDRLIVRKANQCESGLVKSK